MFSFFVSFVFGLSEFSRTTSIEESKAALAGNEQIRKTENDGQQDRVDPYMDETGRICQVKYIVGCHGVVQLGGPVSRYYRVVPPRWGLVSSVLFLIVPMSYEMKNNCLILLSNFILH